MSAYRDQMPQDALPVQKSWSLLHFRPLRLALHLGKVMLPVFAIIMIFPFRGTGWSLAGWGWDVRIAFSAVVAAGALRAYMTMLTSRHTWP